MRATILRFCVARGGRVRRSRRRRTRAARRSCSARPRTPSERRRSPARRRRWTCSSSPASAACGSRRSGRPATGRCPRDDQHGARERRRRGEARQRHGADERHEPGQPHDAAHRRGPGRLRRLRRVGRRGPSPSCSIVIVGNEPNLNRYWLPQFNDDGSDAAAPAYESLLAQHVRRREGRRRPTSPSLGGAVSPRGGDVAGGIRPTHSPTVFIHDMGAGVPRQRPDGADHGRLRLPPVRGQLEHRAGRRDAPELDDDRARRLRQARRAARRGVRRLRAADLVRRVRRRVADPGGEAGALHRHRAGDDEAGHGGDAGRVLPAGGADRVLPAERARPLPLPHRRRDGPRGWQSGLYYADEHAEDEPQADASLRSTSRDAASSPIATGSSCRCKPKIAQRGARADAHLRPRLRVRRAALPPARQAARRRSAAARSAARRRRCRCASRRRRRRTASGCRRSRR